MKTLGVVDRFNSQSAPYHFMPILTHMDPKAVVFYCRQAYLDQLPDEVEKLRLRGIEIVVDTYAGLERHDYLMISDSACLSMKNEQRLENPPENGQWRFFQDRTKPGAKLITYSHSVDDGPSDVNLPGGSFALHPYEWSFLKDSGEAVFMQDENGRVLASRSGHNVERVVIGFTHFAGWPRPQSPAEKQALKDQLAQKLGVAFDPDLPLIAFTYAPMDTDEANEGVARLSGRANIVVKCYPNHAYLGHFDRSLDVTGPNIHHTVDHSLNALMRLAADVNLTSYISSASVSCVAHGLRTIPVCTQKMSSAYPRGTFAYSYYMSFLQKAYARLARLLGPVNIGHTDKLLSRLGPEGEGYWSEYEKALPELQKYIFGNYLIGDEAAELGARYVTNVLRWDSFVSPDFKRRGRAVKGRGDLDFPVPQLSL